MIVLNIIAFIFAIGIIILIHEAGHFYCAKKAGILCHEFSIGMENYQNMKMIRELRYIE